ncbi:hypothetical protein [Desulfofundulus sp.]|uniref:hypothetical protein n=1 Tax=Desulfofundulus sp. TaxID=2282750 RepID=UPI003C7873F8
MVKVIRGRVTAANRDQALREMESRLRKSGHELAGECSLHPCPVQPWGDTIWWEFTVRVRSLAGERYRPA